MPIQLGRVAQLDRAPDSESGGRGFEFLRDRQTKLLSAKSDIGQIGVSWVDWPIPVSRRFRIRPTSYVGHEFVQLVDAVRLEEKRAWKGLVIWPR